MRLDRLLNTGQLEAHIREFYSRVPKAYSTELDILFREPDTPPFDGTYVYSKGLAYRLERIERGEVFVYKATDDPFEISFWALQSITSMQAFRSLVDAPVSDSKYRQAGWDRWLFILAEIDNIFRMRGEVEIAEILSANSI